jgi:hypothetical protein
MNKSSATLIIVGLVALVVGVLVGRFHFGPHPSTDDPAKYVLAFGDSANNNTLVTVANLANFQAALASPVPNWSTLQEVPSEGATPTPVPVPTPTPAGVGTQLVSRVQIIQNRINNSPCTMHVTQRVGLNNPDQVRRVLATLQPETAALPAPTPK